MRKHNWFMLIFLLFFACSDGGGGGGGGTTGAGENEGGGDSNGNGDTEIPVSISWVDEPQTLITYIYDGGRLSGLNFHRNFAVVAGSGGIQLSADLKDTLESADSIDQVVDTFYVEEGREYEIIVDVSIAGQIRCTPLDYDFMIFSSLSATEAIETAIAPILEGDPTTNQIDAFCLNGYVINSITLNQ